MNKVVVLLCNAAPNQDTSGHIHIHKTIRSELGTPKRPIINQRQKMYFAPIYIVSEFRYYHKSYLRLIRTLICASFRSSPVFLLLREGVIPSRGRNFIGTGSLLEPSETSV